MRKIHNITKGTGNVFAQSDQRFMHRFPLGKKIAHAFISNHSLGQAQRHWMSICQYVERHLAEPSKNLQINDIQTLEQHLRQALKALVNARQNKEAEWPMIVHLVDTINAFRDQFNPQQEPEDAQGKEKHKTLITLCKDVARALSDIVDFSHIPSKGIVWSHKENQTHATEAVTHFMMKVAKAARRITLA